MKAAAVINKGEMPVYTTFEEPVVKHENECLVDMKAVAVKHLDKARASGKHYLSEESFKPFVIGGDGVGFLADGTKVFGMGITGTIADKALMKKETLIPVPEGLDDAVAAALPNAVAGSAMALLFKAKLKKGDTVLINGGTGFTGKIAVQMAKYYGAGKVIVTGRNRQSLEHTLSLGADEIISLNQKDEEVMQQLKSVHAAAPIDIVIDYLWGKSAELILSLLKGNGEYAHNIRFVSVGAMSGEHISLSSQILRSTDLYICGSGLGSWSNDEMNRLFQNILPDAFQAAVQGKLHADIIKVKLEDIETAWQTQVEGGSRLAVMIND